MHMLCECVCIYIYSIYSRPIIRRPIIRADLATFKPYPRKLFSFFSSKINMLKSLAISKVNVKLPMGTKRIHLGYQKNPKNLNGSGLFSYLRGLPCQSSRGDPNDHCVDRILGPKNPLLFTTSTFLGAHALGWARFLAWRKFNATVDTAKPSRSEAATMSMTFTWKSRNPWGFLRDFLGIYLGFTGWKSINTVGWVGDFLLG